MKRFLQHGVNRCSSAVIAGLLLTALSWAQSRPQAAARSDSVVATVSSVRATPQSDLPGIEILTSRPTVPSVLKLENPPRVVIDLPNTRVAPETKHVGLQTADVEGVRLSQFREDPPVARIVVDLLKPTPYTWEATGNLVLLRFGAEKTLNAKPQAPAKLAPPPPIDGSRLASGSSVTAGADAAEVRLARGGEVRVCPGTTVSVTPSQNNRSLMLGISTGALETHYSLDATSDSIVTPDFRISLVGPGEFHYAVSADSRGNTCIQALPGNTASVIVSELLGDGTYQVKPTDKVVLHSGQLKNVSLAAGSCGCPAPERPVMLASAAGNAAVTSGAGSETAALPPSNAKDVHVQVDAPFVFRADDPSPAKSVPVVSIEILPLRSPEPAEPIAAAISAPGKPERHGFFGKLRGFFASIFSS